MRHHDREDYEVPDRENKKKTPDKKPTVLDDEPEKRPEGSKDNKIDIRA